MNNIKFDKDKSAIIEYYSNGNVKIKHYKNDNGKLHRIDGPAIIEYYMNGNMKYKAYCLNGTIHRDNGPCVIDYYENGNILSEQYLKNGMLHREDGPAIIDYYEDGEIEAKCYYINDEYLNIDNNDIKIKTIIRLIEECQNIDYLLELKLLVNVKFNKNKELLDLIDSKLIMFKLV